MHMVRHQAVAVNQQIIPGGILFQPVEILLAVSIGEKNFLMSVAALCDMVRHIWNYNSW